MKQPIISVITVCYNSEKTVERTLNSIISQTYKDIEYIIVDGKSTDRTIEIIKSYEVKMKERNIAFTWISEPDKGIYDAMNKGLKLATGELIGIINSDDHYEDDALEIVALEYIKDNSYDVYHGLLKYYDSGSLSMIKGGNSSCLSKHMIEHPTCFIRKKTYDKYGHFNCKYKYVADYELLCRIENNKGKFKLIEKVIANFYDGGAGDCLESVVEALKFRHEYGFISKKEFIIKYVKLRVGRALSK
ncbi:glycosyltransferase family 2 protein [Bacillus mobilis]|uniref:glycosyltransferase family 2 protein n=1 Tax=Bacillus mobilis TaxID=2026190 RepID=UPI002E21FA43|nr:glycosyltransferase family 2 protein [Bacillus mobilis]